MLITSNCNRQPPFVTANITTPENMRISITAEERTGRIYHIDLYNSDYTRAALGNDYYALVAFAKHVLYLKKLLAEDPAPVEIREHSERTRLRFERYDCRQQVEYLLSSEPVKGENAAAYVTDALARYIIENTAGRD